MRECLCLCLMETGPVRLSDPDAVSQRLIARTQERGMMGYIWPLENVMTAENVKRRHL